MKTIKAKILFVVIAALVVITALVSSISVNITHEIMHKDADRILKNVSQKEAAQIDDQLNDFMKSSAIIEHYALHLLDTPSSLADEAYRAKYIENIRVLFDEIAFNTAGANSYYLCLSPELTKSISGFYSAIEKNGNLYELSPEQFSKLTIITDQELIEYSNSSGSESGEWISPHPSRFTGDSVISYITPLYKDSTFIGLLGFNMDFNYLIERTNNIVVYEYGHARLLDETKQICYNPTNDPDLAEEYADVTVTLVNGLNLELRAAYKDIQSGIRPMLTYIVLAFVGVFALALIYTVWTTNKIVGPLKKLTEAARNITSGTQDIDLVVDSKDEIGTLSKVLFDAYKKIREYSAYIKALAYRDSLTGIKNSTAYTEAIDELNKEINRGNPTFGLIVADINDLKKTNDTYGHEIGNELIIRAAKALSDTFKTSSIYRIGGDEFVVILKGHDLDNCHALIERMDTMLASDYIQVKDKKVPISIARGVALFNSGIDTVYTDVFANADHAMYLNKEEMCICSSR